jgi:hypothetical protein
MGVFKVFLIERLVPPRSSWRSDSQEVPTFTSLEEVKQESQIDTALGAVHRKAMRRYHPLLSLAREGHSLLPCEHNVQHQAARLNPKNPFVA